MIEREGKKGWAAVPLRVERKTESIKQLTVSASSTNSYIFVIKLECDLSLIYQPQGDHTDLVNGQVSSFIGKTLLRWLCHGVTVSVEHDLTSVKFNVVHCLMAYKFKYVSLIVY